MTPAQTLTGRTLPNGWRVGAAASRSKTATGGHFSKGYIAHHADGRRGFLKAMDYYAAFEQDNPAPVLEAMTNAYLFEKSICEKCSTHHLRRVVHAIESGTIQVDPKLPFSKVEYLIFELADGDIRGHLDTQDDLDLVFAFRTLHHVATGLEQLHRADIAHQDLKPSNVLVFAQESGAKIGDFGRAWSKEFRAPHDHLRVAGDRNYAPPELLYRSTDADVSKRRYGCDMYHLGSLVVFFFARVHTNALLAKNLAPEHLPFNWGGTYAEILPYVQTAFGKSLAEFADHTPHPFRDDLVQIVTYLCQPDPARRGHPSSGADRAQFSLDRFITKFDLLAYKASGRIFGGSK
jgi:serine/threonine protein kinase